MLPVRLSSRVSFLYREIGRAEPLSYSLPWTLRKKEYAPGTMFWLYLAVAALARLVVEICPVNPVLVMGLTDARWFSVAMR